MAVAARGGGLAVFWTLCSCYAETRIFLLVPLLKGYTHLCLFAFNEQHDERFES